eukprot:jgi/Botrbrau1/6358/Bobra.0098s0017.1
MEMFFECIFSDSTYEHRVPDGLMDFDEIFDLMRTCKVDSAILPFSLQLKNSTVFEGDPVQAPLSSTLAAMHEIELDDTLLNSCPLLCEVKVMPQLSELDDGKRRDIEQLLEEFSDLFSSGKDDLGCISDPEMLYGYMPKLPLAVRDVLVNVAEALSPEHHVCKLQDKLRKQYDLVARALDNAMHKNIIGQAHKLRRKTKCTDLEVGDLVLEVANIAGPLQTGLKGPFKIVSLNDTKTIAVLETGHTRFKERKSFKRHTSHLVKYHEPLRDWGGGGGVHTSRDYKFHFAPEYFPENNHQAAIMQYEIFDQVELGHLVELEH